MARTLRISYVRVPNTNQKAIVDLIVAFRVCPAARSCRAGFLLVSLRHSPASWDTIVSLAQWDRSCGPAQASGRARGGTSAPATSLELNVRMRTGHGKMQDPVTTTTIRLLGSSSAAAMDVPSPYSSRQAGKYWLVVSRCGGGRSLSSSLG